MIRVKFADGDLRGGAILRLDHRDLARGGEKCRGCNQNCNGDPHKTFGTRNRPSSFSGACERASSFVSEPAGTSSRIVAVVFPSAVKPPDIGSTPAVSSSLSCSI